jgi:hypothetical protein
VSAEISGPWCSHCRTPLSAEHTGPCPGCGKTGKTWGVATGGTITPAASVEKTRRVALGGTISPAGKLETTRRVVTGGTVAPTAKLDRTREHRGVVEKRRAMKWVLRVLEGTALVIGFWIGEWWSFALGLALLILGEVFGARTIQRIERDHWHDAER